MHAFLATLIGVIVYNVIVLIHILQRVFDGVTIFTLDTTHTWLGSWIGLLLVFIGWLVVAIYAGAHLGLGLGKAYESLSDQHRTTVNVFIRRGVQLAYAELVRSKTVQRHRWLAWIVRVVAPAIRTT